MSRKFSEYPPNDPKYFCKSIDGAGSLVDPRILGLWIVFRRLIPSLLLRLGLKMFSIIKLKVRAAQVHITQDVLRRYRPTNQPSTFTENPLNQFLEPGLQCVDRDPRPQTVFVSSSLESDGVQSPVWILHSVQQQTPS